MKNFLWVMTIFGSLIGGLTFFLGVGGAESAVQEAAAAGMAMAWAVIPYCLARAVSELSQGERD